MFVWLSLVQSKLRNGDSFAVCGRSYKVELVGTGESVDGKDGQ